MWEEWSKVTRCGACFCSGTTLAPSLEARAKVDVRGCRSTHYTHGQYKVSEVAFLVAKMLTHPKRTDK